MIAMITLSSVVAAIEAIRRLIHPHAISHLGWVAVAGIVGFIGNELVALYRIREGNAIGSAALVADGYHARTDGFTSLAVVAGALGVAHREVDQPHGWQPVHASGQGAARADGHSRRQLTSRGRGSPSRDRLTSPCRHH